MSEQLNLSSLKPAAPRRARKRVGRGMGSGKGRYAGRGIKGQKARSGSAKMRPGFEGGQMPVYMRLGKQRGATSKDAMPIGPFRTSTVPVNVRELERFENGTEVTPDHLREAGVIKNTRTDVKILGEGNLSKRLVVSAHSFSQGAREKIEQAGGTVIWLRGEPAAKRPVRKRGPVEGVRGKREAPAVENEASEVPAKEASADEGDGQPTAEEETES